MTLWALAQPATSEHSFLEALAPFVVVFFVAWVISFVMTPLMRILAVRNGVVDWPDLKRKSHLEPVAYLGGVAIFLGWLGGVMLCYFIATHLSVTTIRRVPFPLPIILGATIITLTGLFDDVYGISPRVKIGGQLLAAAMIATQDVGTRLMAESFLVVGYQAPEKLCYVLGAVLIAFFVLGGCNAVNLMDGLDGLASGVCAIATIGFLLISVHVLSLGADINPTYQQQPQEMLFGPVRLVLCLALLGALLGFLPYNFNQANIFMGDAGSLLLGYLSVTTILTFAHASPQRGPLLVMAALIVFALPITDTALAIFRRLMRRQSVFSPDNHHLHHQMLRLYKGMGFGPGASVKAAVLSMYLLAAIFAVLGYSLVYLRWRYVMAVFFPLFGFVVVTAYKAGHQQILLQKLGAAEGPSNPEETGHHAVDQHPFFTSQEASTPVTQTQPPVTPAVMPPKGPVKSSPSA